MKVLTVLSAPVNANLAHLLINAYHVVLFLIDNLLLVVNALMDHILTFSMMSVAPVE